MLFELNNSVIVALKQLTTFISSKTEPQHILAEIDYLNDIFLNVGWVEGAIMMGQRDHQTRRNWIFVSVANLSRLWYIAQNQPQ